jgi:hypothetical protein
MFVTLCEIRFYGYFIIYNSLATMASRLRQLAEISLISCVNVKRGPPDNALILLTYLPCIIQIQKRDCYGITIPAPL